MNGRVVVGHPYLSAEALAKAEGCPTIVDTNCVFLNAVTTTLRLLVRQ